MNICVQIFVWTCVFISLGYTYLRVEMVEYLVTMFPLLKKHQKTKQKRNTRLFSKVPVPFLYFHQQVHEDFSLSTSLLILVIVFFILVILVDKKWYFFVVLICISLWLIMLNILSCAYCVCLYLLEKFLFRFFAHFLIGWCMFDLFLLNYKVFYIESLVKVICHIYDLGIFYPIL